MVMKKAEEMMKNKKELVMSGAISSILFSLLLVLPFINKVLTYNPAINDFSSHTMSWATASDLNIATRINTYYVLFAGIIFFSVLFFLVIFSVFSKKYNENTISFFAHIKQLSFIGIAGLVASILSSTYDLSLYIVGGAVVLGWIYIKFTDSNHLDINLLVWNMLMSISLSLFVWVLSKNKHIISELSKNIYMQKLEMPIDIIYFVFIWILISIVLLLISNKIISRVSAALNIPTKDSLDILITAGIPVIFTGIVQSFMLEVLNILNKQFNIVINRPTLMYFLIMICSWIIMGIIFTRLLKKKKNPLNKGKLINKVYLPAILVTFVLIIVQPARMMTVGNEYFEMANHGLSIDHLFRYGSIPIIENFDAHMLSNQIFAFFYSILNGYEPWAAFLYDQYIQVFYILVLFFLLRSLIGYTNSFFFILTFPLLENLFSMTYLLSGILVFSIYKCYKNNSALLNSFGFWLTAGLLCVYRLDLGFAAIIGGIFTYIIICYMYNLRSLIYKFLASGVVSGIMAVMLFVILCLLKGIDPKNRIIEFIKLCQSNQNWAYVSVGDNTLIAYTLGYYVLPILIVIILLFTIIKYLLLKNELLKMNQQNLIMFLFFSVFFIFNISRGIVRHSLAEGSLIFTLGTVSWALLSFVAIQENCKDKIGKFLIAAIVTVVLINSNLTTLKGSESLSTKAFDSQNYQEKYTEMQSFSGTRVIGDLPSDAEELKEILDAVLSEDETYFDFSSTNYFYALVGRKNPIYANQSPLMISDDKTQELALDEMKSKKPPLVLMPISGKAWSEIDNIAVDYKYYMISEYIYENYTPLIRLPSFDVYSLKSKHENYLDILEGNSLLRKNVYSGDFSNAKLKEISNHNTTISNNYQGELKVEAVGEDPYITGSLFDFIGDDSDDIKYERSKSTTFKIKYEASKVGSLQLFYTLKEDEDFSESQSRTYSILSNEEGSVEIELPSLPYKLRFDIDAEDVTLKRINIYQGLKTVNKQPEIWSRDIGAIPMLWAERDSNQIYQKAPYLTKPMDNINHYSVDTHDIIKNKPMYLILEIESEENRSASIELGSIGKGKLGEFIFRVSKGSHEYAIRLSTDYKWWNNEVEYINLGIDGNISINKFAFLPENE